MQVGDCTCMCLLSISSVIVTPALMRSTPVLARHLAPSNLSKWHFAASSHFLFFPRARPNHPVKPVGGDEKGLRKPSSMRVLGCRLPEGGKNREIESRKDQCVIGPHVHAKERDDDSRNSPGKAVLGLVRSHRSPPFI